MLPQPQQRRGLDLLFRRQVVIPGIAYCPEEDGIRILADFYRLFGKRRAVLFNGNASYIRFSIIEFYVEFPAYSIQYGLRCLHDLRPDAIAWQYRYLVRFHASSWNPFR